MLNLKTSVYKICHFYLIDLFIVGKLWLDNLLLAFAGACATSTFNLTLQMGIELTYPASILMTAGLLGFLQQTMARD